MSRRGVRFARRLALLALPGVLVLSSFATARADGPSYETVVSGLRNPRGIDFSADGRLYVAEGGEGGKVVFRGVATEEGGPLAAGFSARISRVDVTTSKRTDYITGLVSVGGPLFAIGASGLAVQGNQVSALMGLNDFAIPSAQACGFGDACRAIVTAATAQLGHLLRGVTSGRYSWQQDVGAFNYIWTVTHKATIGAGDPAYQPGWALNPDFRDGDANPYALADAPGGTWMVDGGSNTLTWVPRKGSPKVVAAFPQPDPPASETNPVPYDAVPTCVAPSGGKVVVSDLHGRIFVVDSSSLTVKPAAVKPVDGAFLAAAGGCAADGKGNVYISDIFVGSLVKLSLDSMTLSWVRPPSTFNFPSGVAIGKDGKVYVSNNSVCPSFRTPPSGDPASPNPCGSAASAPAVTGSIVRITP